MNADDIAAIRHMRGHNIPWHVIARRLGCTVAECRQAIGMPEYDKPAERRVMPWDVVQRTLPFSESEG